MAELPLVGGWARSAEIIQFPLATRYKQMEAQAAAEKQAAEVKARNERIAANYRKPRRG